MKQIAVLFGLLWSLNGLAAVEVYVIDNAHTLPRFEYNHLGFSNQVGRFDQVSGHIQLDRQHQRGRITVEINAASVSTGSDIFDQHLKSREFFDVEQYPLIYFNSDQLVFEQERLIAVHGVLTIKGIEQPVRLQVHTFKCALHPVYEQPTCGVNASADIRRSDFGLDKHVPYVSDDVKLHIPVEAVRSVR